MATDLPTALMREGFGVMVAVGWPFVLGLLVVGLIVGMLQAATQINDSAIGFLPRLIAGLLVAYFTGYYVVERLSQYFAAALRTMSGRM
jgi:flagellar biosynthesis protein FliQ